MNPLHAVYGVIALLIVGYVVHCERLKTANAAALVIAEQAKEVAELKAKEYQDAKENADEALKAARTANADLARRLRDARSNRGFLPTPTPGTPSPDRASFDRAELERALQRLDAGVSAIAERGDEAIIGLDSARKWARDVRGGAE